MFLKKSLLALMFALCIVLFSQSFVNRGQVVQTTTQGDYEVDPPTVTRVTIQKLPVVNLDYTNVIVRVSYQFYEALPESIIIYSSGTQITLHDDGLLGDHVSGDNEYTGYMRVDFADMKNKLSGFETSINNKGHVIYFEGHNGIQVDNANPFNEIDFDAGLEVEVDQHLILAEDCNAELEKHKSLFITDLSVVEDPIRTFNIQDNTGNPIGIHTFGNLMLNMANEGLTGTSPKEFIKSWIKPFTIDHFDPNNLNQVVHEKREFVLKYMIAPWISKAKNKTSVDPTITLTNWETQWNQCDEAKLLKFAPFKLTTIANRLDLRGNTSFKTTISRAGETRFIFSLINLYLVEASDDPDAVSRGAQGAAVENPLHGGSSDFLDWKGMNVIFEYLNVQTDKCALKSFAQKWLDLSNLEFGESFNEALEDITETVINANAISGAPNGSAIGRIRTNEKIFFRTQSILNDNWAKSNWQFKQFEINRITHLLEEKYLNNTPIVSYNNPKNINTPLTIPFPKTTIGEIMDMTEWAYTNKNKFQILQERHRIPETYNGWPMLSISGEVVLEYNQYFDMDYGDANSNIPGFKYTVEANGNNKIARDLRHKLSLNTCQGCHSGETKTVFTHVAPLGYKESAKYWGTTPDYRSGVIDVDPRKLVANFPNGGKTIEPDNVTISDNYVVPSGSRDFVNVSAFITGRTYNGGSYQDDLIEPGAGKEDNSDQDLEGLFYVNDPSNTYNSTVNANLFGRNDMKNGLNELSRRRRDMCALLRSNCNHYFDQNNAEPMDFIIFMDDITKIVLVE